MMIDQRTKEDAMHRIQIDVETEAKALEVADLIEKLLADMTPQASGFTPEEVLVIPLD
jgi:hypothetical protein